DVYKRQGFLYNQTAPASSFTPFKHAFFLPYQVIHWHEFWFPIKGLKRVVAASPSGALNVEERISDFQKISGGKIESKGSVDQQNFKPRFSPKMMTEEKMNEAEFSRGAKNRKILIEFCPVIPGEKEIRIEVEGQTIYKDKINFNPLILWQKEIFLPQTARYYEVILGEGEIIWRSDEPSLKLSRPIKAPSEFNWDSAEGYFQMGEELARQRRFKEAIRAYQNCLQKEPGHIRALTRLAELELRADRLQAALELAKKALMLDAYDPAANFVYGSINRRLGNLADSLDGFSWASRSLDFRSGAFTEMAEIFFLRGDLWRAKEYIQRALKVEAENMAARELDIIISRTEGKKEEAEAKIKKSLEIEPLNHLARFEAYLLEPNDQNVNLFLRPISNELPHETFLELAFRYSQIGLIEEATRLLELGPQHPLIDLTLAYFLRDGDINKSEYFLNRALDEKSKETSFIAIFPYRQEMIPIIKWAKATKPHWKLDYWLALILWNLGRESEAQKLFLGCSDQPDWSSFYLTRADFFLSQGKEREAFDDIQKAIDLEPKNWRAWHRHINLLERRGEDKLALEKAQKIYPYYPENSILILDLARGLLRNGRFEEMLSFLSKVIILPYEGAWEGRDLYRQANVLLASEALAKRKWTEAARFLELAKKWPENLGAGQPYEPDERIELYLQGLIYERQKKKPLAFNCWQKVIAQSKGKEEPSSLMSLVTALAWKKLGEIEKARALCDQWSTRWPEKMSLQWAAAYFAQDYRQAQKIAENWLIKNQKKSLWNLAEADHYWPLLLKILGTIQEN
ncbi:MAG: tetratricopeptide repeat protein, partial [Candidatus Aminicenantes bacterium]|nr:tetratricopeptide repeat protein [Candidatus Aminicenantes bacterium]